MRSSRTLLPFLAGCLLLASCFEDPVVETLHLEVEAGGTVELTATTRISALYLDTDADPRLVRRIDQEQRMMAQGWDAWPARFERAAPAEDSVSFRREERELVEVERWARLTDPESVERFFSDLLTATYRPALGAGAPTGELAFYAAWPARATGGERQQVEQALGPWSATVAAYLAAVADLYAWLDDHPRRARPCFQQLFEDVLPDESTDLSREERSLVAAVRQGMDDVVAVLLVQEGDVHTLNELTRKVYDPFPGRVTVDLPAGAEVVEVEGFVESAGGWEIPPLDLWGAFGRLAERWSAPDPALAWVEANLAWSRLDLDAWLAAERRTAAPPSPPRVLRALEAELTPQPVYRLAWRRPGAR